MDESDFADMVEQTPVRTYVIEYREPSVDGRPGKLVGACLSDQQSDGLSMIYSFFDVGPDARKGLGTFIILDHVVRAARAGLPYVYLGYWVEGSTRMAYKTSFRPLERLGRDGWRRMDEVEVEPAAKSIALPSRRSRSRLLIRRLIALREPASRERHRADDAAREQGRLQSARAQVNQPIEAVAGECVTELVQPQPRIREPADQQFEAAEHQPASDKDDRDVLPRRRKGHPEMLRAARMTHEERVRRRARRRRRSALPRCRP